MGTRLISFAGSSLTIAYSGARPAKIIDFLYRYIPTNNSISPRLTYHLLPGADYNRLTLYRGEMLLYAGNSEADLAECLLGDTCHQLASVSQGGLLFHAASISWQGRGLLLPGPTGAGKSTLAAWLLLKGFDYLTDELVFVPRETETMQAFTRPLNLKHSSKPALQNYIDLDGQGRYILSNSHSDLIQPTVLNCTKPVSEAALNLIIFPHYQSSGEFLLRPLSKAQAGLALMQCLINARNLPEHGFSEVARLVRQVSAYQLNYTDFAQIGEQIETLLSSSSSM